MAVRFILGRAGSGKTRVCLDEIAAALADSSDAGKLVLIVPEQASLQMERALAERCATGGYFRAEVLSFSRLAQRVFDELGEAPEVLSASGRRVALRAVVERCGEAQAAFSTAARSVGFVAELERVIQELMNEGVDAAALRRAAADIPDGGEQRRLLAIASAYAEYAGWLGARRIDPAQRLAIVRRSLDQVTWLPAARVWVDGFAGFTGEELATLASLGRRVRNVSITLLLDPRSEIVDHPELAPDPLALFARTEQTYARLWFRLNGEHVAIAPALKLAAAIPPRFSAESRLARLEGQLAASADRAAPPPDDSSHAALRVLACETPRDEFRAAAGWIRRTLLEAGGRLRLRDFAVIARDLEPLASLAAEVFDEFELPHFIDRRRPVRSHALSRLTTTLLEAVRRDLPADLMSCVLSLDMIAAPRRAAEQLDELVVNTPIAGWAAWEQPLTDFGAGVDELRRRIVAALSPLRGLHGRSSAAGREWVVAIHTALEALGAPQRLREWIADARRARDWQRAELHRLAWEALCELLDHLHDTLGDALLTLRDVEPLIASSLADLSLGIAPPTLDQVLISSIERSRHPDIKYAWIVGMNEGVFPPRPSESPLLSDELRTQLRTLGLTSLPTGADDLLGERLLAYIAVTRPLLGVTLSFHRMSESGEERFASPLLREIQELAGITTRPREAAIPTCASEIARRTNAAARGPKERRSAVRARVMAALRPRVEPALLSRIERQLAGLDYDNSVADVPDAVGAAAPWTPTATEISRYVACPFQWLASSGLRLREPRGPEPLARRLGSRAHALLAAVTNRAIASGRSSSTIGDDEWLAWLGECAAALEAPTLAPREMLMVKEHLARIDRVLLVHAQRWRQGSFEPWKCELPFGPTDADADALPGPQIASLGERRVMLRGRIDRVDRARLGDVEWLVVYDYKSTARPLGGSFVEGESLQILSYLIALRASGRRAGGVLIAPLQPQFAELSRPADATDARDDRALRALRPRGVFNAALYPAFDADADQRDSPVVSAPIKKDGGHSGRSDAVDSAAFERRVEVARRTLQLAGEGALSGRIAPAPLVVRKTLACHTCAYRPVCRFEFAFNGARPAKQALPQVENVGSSGDAENEDAA